MLWPACVPHFSSQISSCQIPKLSKRTLRRFREDLFSPSFIFDFIQRVETADVCLKHLAAVQDV
jgi:hypothetical protein